MSYSLQTENNYVITKSELIKEAKWYNTVMDFAGIIDPTGSIDLINAVSYFRQGDYFYSFLSFLSAVPFADIVSKPVMGAAKVGVGSTKALKNATNLMKTNPAKAAKIIQGLSKGSGPVGTFVRSAPKWAPKVIASLGTKTAKLPLVPKLIEWLSFLLKSPRLTRVSGRVLGYGPQDNNKSSVKTDLSVQNDIDVKPTTTTPELPNSDDPLMKMFSSILSGNKI